MPNTETRTSQRFQLVCVLALTLMATGCATSAQQGSDTAPAVAEESAREPEGNRGPNPAGKVIGGCGRGAIEMLRLGPLGLPFTVGILAVCMPLAAVVGIAHEVLPASASNDGSGAPDFTYPGGASPSDNNFGGRGSAGFTYPNSYNGCPWSSCR